MINLGKGSAMQLLQHPKEGKKMEVVFDKSLGFKIIATKPVIARKNIFLH